MEYQLTGFSRRLFPQLQDGLCITGLKEDIPYFFSPKHGYLYRYMAVFEIGANFPEVNAESLEIGSYPGSYLCGLGYSADGFRNHVKRLPSLDRCERLISFMPDSRTKKIDEFVDACARGMTSASTHPWANRPDKDEIRTVLMDYDSRLRLPEAQSFVCVSDLIENQGFVEGCSYYGLKVALLRDKIIIRDDGGTEHVLPDDLFRPE